LLELGQVRLDLRGRGYFHVDHDRRFLEIVPSQLNHFTDDSSQIDERGRTRLRADEPGQVADDFAGAAAMRLEQRNLLQRRSGQMRVALEKLRRAENGLQWIVQFVRDA